MTAAQKTAKAKFKQAIAYRQKTGVTLKEAFAHIYGKKKVGVVKKKAAPKKKVAKKVVRKVVKKKVVKKVAKKKTIKKVINKLSGLYKIIGSVSGKYYIEYITEYGYKKMEFFNKFPKGYYKGMNRIIYVTRLTNLGTALIPVKFSDNNVVVKK